MGKQAGWKMEKTWWQPSGTLILFPVLNVFRHQLNRVSFFIMDICSRRVLIALGRDMLKMYTKLVTLTYYENI